jgi:hypothetical protein
MALVRVMSSLTGQARSLVDRLPDQVSQELVGVAGRLAKVRSPAQLGEVMEAELTRSLASVVPLLSRTPFPARSPGAARLMVAGVAGTAGAMQAIDELAALLGGSVAAVSAALVSLVLAWGVEVWATVAVRVRQLEEAGRQPDPARLASEVARAVMDGAGSCPVRSRSRPAGGPRPGSPAASGWAWCPWSGPSTRPTTPSRRSPRW